MKKGNCNGVKEHNMEYALCVCDIVCKYDQSHLSCKLNMSKSAGFKFLSLTGNCTDLF